MKMLIWGLKCTAIKVNFGEKHILQGDAGEDCRWGVRGKKRYQMCVIWYQTDQKNLAAVTVVTVRGALMKSKQIDDT